MANKRIFYACQRVGIAPPDSLNVTTVRGLQSLNMTTTFNLEQVFEIGQLAVYENIEGIPDIEVSCEKVLDGSPPLYCLATQEDGDGNPTTSSTLSGRSMGQCNMVVAIFPETVTNANDDSQLGAEVHMSGLFVSSVGYNVTVDGNATESVTLVGNNRVWVVGGDTGNWRAGAYSTEAASWDNTPEAPWTEYTSPTGDGGVNRRENVLFGTGVYASLLPLNIPGISGYNNGSGANMLSGGQYGAHIQSWNINTDLGREELFELGRRGTYYRYVNFPVEVTNEITVISTSGDMISATEEGLYGSNEDCGTKYNLADNLIRLRLCEGLLVDCGSKNKLSNVSQTGGDAGGGNVEVTYSYTNFNDFDVKHQADPVVGPPSLRPGYAP